MTYTQKLPPKEYAKLRTQPEHIRQLYEQRANQALKETVAKEQAHFQKQVDEYKEYASKEIEKAWQEAEHWRKQCEIIFGLMEQSEGEIKKEREEYAKKVGGLEREVERLKREKANRNKSKRITNRET